MKIRMYMVNGKSYETDASGNNHVSRVVLERNVLDMLEDNEKYMSLSFCDAQIIVEEATSNELMRIYTELMSEDEFARLYNRVLG